MAGKRGVVQWLPDAPDDVEGPPVNVRSPKARGKLVFICTSPRIYWVLTHWGLNRSHPCTGSLNGCEFCEKGTNVRTKGYVSGFFSGEGRSHIVELTKTSLMGSSINSSDTNLRGLQLTVSRPGAAKNSQLVTRITGGRSLEEAIPGALDVMAIMERLWFGAANG